MKYTYSDDEDDIYSDTTTSRRSTRNTRRNTPEGPTVTQSGRQVKSRQGGAYGESVLSGARASVGLTDEADNSESTGGRPRRAAAAAVATNGRPKGGRHIEGYNNVDEMTSDEEGDASEQDYGDDEEDDHVSLASDVDDQDELTDNEEEAEVPVKQNGEKKSLLVKLPIKTPTPEKKTSIKLKLSPEKDQKSTQPTDKDGSGNAVAENQSNPINIATKSPAPPAPLSPRSPLAFRGSPEKRPAALPPSIGVGFGGS